jgi:3-phenylpropionate/trans-cinnamate dioxygenase ferredoxin subunit
MARLIKIAETGALPPGKAASYDVEGTQVAVFNVGGTFYAIDDTCTHSGGPLCEGQVSGAKVTCPWHGADFDLKTGAALTPPADEGVKSYKVVITGNAIQIEVG